MDDPKLRAELKDILDKAKQNKMANGVTGNGTAPKRVFGELTLNREKIMQVQAAK